MALEKPVLKESEPALLRTPKGMRMHIGLFGRRNVGKSSILNAITNQQVSIVSEVAGTTTDPVDKPMELLPLGPVLFIDTAGIDDDQLMVGELRTQQTMRTFDRCDLGILVFEAGNWGDYEQALLQELNHRAIPCILVVNKMDLLQEGAGVFGESVAPKCDTLVQMTASQKQGVEELRQALLKAAPAEFVEDQTLFGDVVVPGSTVVLVIPIDKEAPKGRIILPQVQSIRDLLDHGCMPYCCTVEDLPKTLESLKKPPALVVTDSQAFGRVSKMVPENIPLTGFSVAFARLKGDLKTQVAGTKAIASLTEDSKVLIAESCTHHPIEEDIGTVKIPKLLRKKVGQGLSIAHVRGKDFPEDLSEYDLVIHCGGCMFNRRAMLTRIQKCVESGVPVSNYGLTLAYCNGIFERAIEPFETKEESSL